MRTDPIDSKMMTQALNFSHDNFAIQNQNMFSEPKIQDPPNRIHQNQPTEQPIGTGTQQTSSQNHSQHFQLDFQNQNASPNDLPDNYANTSSLNQIILELQSQLVESRLQQKHLEELLQDK